MGEVFINKHPLVQHKITRLRDKTTGTNEFRNLVEEIGMLMGYEALADLATEDIEVETPLERTLSPVIAGRKMAVVPILRAGLGMVNGIQALVPTAKVGHIGLYRDPDTHEPVEYYCKLPTPIEERTIAGRKCMVVESGLLVACFDNNVGIDTIEAIAKSADSHIINDIRRRTRLGMGTCQGNFCSLRAAGIFHRREVPIAAVKTALLDRVPVRQL